MGKQAQPTSTTVTQSSFPPEAAPYLTDILNQGEALANQPYVPYGGQQLANVSPYTTQAYGQAAGLGSIGQGSFDAASGALTGAQGAAAGLQHITAPNINAPNLNNYQMSGVAPVQSANWTDPGTASAYMNPYEQQALQGQINIANQQFGQQQNQADSAAVQNGAYGGDRAELVKGQNLNNYNLQMQNMVGQGLANAYSQGQTAFQGDRSANLLAQEANQQSGLTTQNANLQANLATQSLGAQTGLQAQTANAQNYLNAQNQNLNAAQLQGQIGSQLSNLGQAQQGAAATGLNALYAAGQSQQNQQQQGLDIQYQNFINQQQYPEQQLNFLSGILHGFNVSPNSYTQTGSAYVNPVSQLVGGGLGLSSLSGLLGNSQSGQA